jgi:hypothetical protein
VRRLHDDTYTTRLEDFRNGKGNLLGQALLDLKSAGEHLCQTSQLGQAKDTTVRDIANVHLN